MLSKKITQSMRYHFKMLLLFYSPKWKGNKFIVPPKEIRAQAILTSVEERKKKSKNKDCIQESNDFLLYLFLHIWRWQKKKKLMQDSEYTADLDIWNFLCEKIHLRTNPATLRYLFKYFCVERQKWVHCFSYHALKNLCTFYHVPQSEWIRSVLEPEEHF